MRKLHRTAPPTWSRAIGAGVLALGMAALAPVDAGANSAAPTKATADLAVTQHNLQFDPGMLKVGLGQKVVWTNHETDQTIHSVVQKGGSEINSPDIPPETSFEWVFTSAGRYDIVCRFHPDMFMTIEVSAKPANAVKPAKKLSKAEQKKADAAAKKAAKKAAKEMANHDVHADSARKSTPAAEPGDPASTIPGIGGLPFDPQPTRERGRWM